MSQADRRLEVLQGHLAPIAPIEASETSGVAPKKMPKLTSHVLDTAIGKPAPGIKVQLHTVEADGTFKLIAEGETNSDGRIPAWSGNSMDALEKRVYRLTFDTAEYFGRQGVRTFYPTAQITFEVFEDTKTQHHHVPLLVSPYGFSTYRGS